ncbi:MAG TPA: LOG family protein [Kaistiaceae bacterium]|nr:LOG family protein [Kaistiaceae bacterium]
MNPGEDPFESVLSSAEDDLEAWARIPHTAQTLSPAYRLAYADREFLLRDEMRGVRLQLELMKPALELDERGIRSTVVIFGGARIPEPGAAPERAATDEIAYRLRQNARYYDAARAFARLSSEASLAAGGCEFVVVSGGGPGIMEAANRGAADVGAHSVGLSIVLPHEQLPNRFVTPELCFQFHYFAIRKMHFLMRAKALAYFAGGFGTLDELFEALCLIQTGKIDRVPILLFGREFWRRVLNLDALVDEGTISPEDLELFTYVESAEEGWREIAEFYGL